VTDLGETIMKYHIRDQRVKGGVFDRFEARSVLFEDNRITSVQGTKKQHHHQKRRDRHFAPRQLKDETVETRTILNNRLCIPLHVIEDREKGRERV
jgi:hypothetical protein